MEHSSPSLKCAQRLLSEAPSMQRGETSQTRPQPHDPGDHTRKQVLLVARALALMDRGALPLWSPESP